MSDITNDGENLDENGLDMDSKYYEERKKMLDNEGTTYGESEGRLVRLEDIRQEKVEQAQAENNYWNVLTSEADRIKADNDKDGKITYDEYREYILAQENAETASTVPDNTYNYETNHAYSLDLTTLIGIVVVCVTAIIITYILKRKPSP